MVQGFSQFVLFLFLGLLRAPTRNSPERVRDTIWTFSEKSGKHLGLEPPPGLASLKRNSKKSRKGDQVRCVVADVWEKDVWDFHAESGSSGPCRPFLHQGAPKGRQQKGEIGSGTHIFADFCRFSLIFGSLCKSRDLGVADLRGKPQETADFRRKPQIFAETGFSHLLSLFWRAPTKRGLFLTVKINRSIPKFHTDISLDARSPP